MKRQRPKIKLSQGVVDDEHGGNGGSDDYDADFDSEDPELWGHIVLEDEYPKKLKSARHMPLSESEEESDQESDQEDAGELMLMGDDDSDSYYSDSDSENSENIQLLRDEWLRDEWLRENSGGYYRLASEEFWDNDEKVLKLGGATPEEDLLKVIKLDNLSDMYYRLKTVNLEKALLLAMESGDKYLIELVKELIAGNNCWWTEESLENEKSLSAYENISKLPSEQQVTYFECMDFEDVSQHLMDNDEGTIDPKEFISLVETAINQEKWNALLNFIKIYQPFFYYTRGGVETIEFKKQLEIFFGIKEDDDVMSEIIPTFKLFTSEHTNLLHALLRQEKVVKSEILPPIFFYKLIVDTNYNLDKFNLSRKYIEDFRNWANYEDYENVLDKLSPITHLRLVKMGIFSPNEEVTSTPPLLEHLLYYEDEPGFFDEDNPDIDPEEIYKLTINPKVKISNINTNEIVNDNLKNAFKQGLLERKARLAQKQIILETGEEKDDLESSDEKGKTVSMPSDVWKHIMVRSKLNEYCQIPSPEQDLAPAINLMNFISNLLEIPREVIREKISHSEKCQFFVDVFTFGPKYSEDVAERVREREIVRESMKNLRKVIENMESLNMDVPRKLKQTMMDLQDVYLRGSPHRRT